MTESEAAFTVISIVGISVVVLIVLYLLIRLAEPPGERVKRWFYASGTLFFTFSLILLVIDTSVKVIRFIRGLL